MDDQRSRRRLALAGAGLAAVIVGVLALAVLATGSSGGADLTVYTARLHYGEEAAFREFAEREGLELKLFGGSGPALNERLRAEGAQTAADVLITVDAANLAQAERDDLLQPTRSAVLEANIPAPVRDPGGRWFGLTTRARTIMRSTERVGAGDLRTYEDLGDRRWRGRLCLRTSDSVYNSSFVADRIARHGRAATERMLRAWMANEPEILGSDVDVLEAIAGRRCDVGLANSYYLGRKLDEDPHFAVAPVWADQDGAGTHVNLSGFGVTRHAKHPEAARRLVEYLSQPDVQARFAETNFEFPANPRAPLPERLREWGRFKLAPVEVGRSSGLQADATQLMNEVGWR